MKTSQHVALVLLSSLLLITPKGQADSIRCGGHLIRDGGSHGSKMYEVLKKCGEPESRAGYTWFYRLHGRYWALRFDGNGNLLSINRAD